MIAIPHVDETALLLVLDASEAEQVKQWLGQKLMGPILGESEPG